MAIGSDPLLRHIRVRRLEASNQHVNADWLLDADLDALMARVIKARRGHKADRYTAPARRRLKQAEIGGARHVKVANGKIQPGIANDSFRFQNACRGENTHAKTFHDSARHAE